MYITIVTVVSSGHCDCLRIRNPPKGQWYCPACCKSPGFNNNNIKYFCDHKKNFFLLSQLSHKIINHCHMIQKYYNLLTILGNNRSCCSPAVFPKSFIKMDSRQRNEISEHTCKINVSIRVTYLPILVITYLPQNGQSTLKHTSREPNPFYLFVLSIPDAVWMKARTFFSPWWPVYGRKKLFSAPPRGFCRPRRNMFCGYQ